MRNRNRRMNEDMTDQYVIKMLKDPLPEDIFDEDFLHTLVVCGTAYQYRNHPHASEAIFRGIDFIEENADQIEDDTCRAWVEDCVELIASAMTSRVPYDGNGLAVANYIVNLRRTLLDYAARDLYNYSERSLEESSRLGRNRMTESRLRDIIVESINEVFDEMGMRAVR